MPLQPGTRLGPYEVIALIGAGGMGEVWLATELRLGRKVALKLLPPDLTRDPARLLRFEQEARSASTLNHPNVCTIHALGETDEDQHYIAMEYVEGETLRRRLATCRLSVREALDIAIQMASALTAAHAGGIIHRDIKPENVMLRPDGLVKVLDFGLAKLVAQMAGADTTRVVVRTDPGTIVGTVAYMSPEQARGQDVDARTDIWSLGVTLYEMVAGRSPFAASSSTDVLAAILDREPAPLARFDPDAPAELQRITTKALRKDREQRYQTARDVLLDLQTLRDDLPSYTRSGSGPTVLTSTGNEPSAMSDGPFGPPRRRRAGIAVAAALTVAMGALGAWWWFNGRTPEQAVHTPSVQRSLTRLTFGGGLQAEATWSLDGRSIAYASDQGGNSDIWVQSLGGGDPVQLTRSPGEDTEPSWSPDGRNIVFRSDREGGGLFVVPAVGGPERQLTSVGWHPQWTPEGSQILFRTGGADGIGLFVRLHAVAADGGTPPREILRDTLRGGSWDWIGSHPDGRISALGIHRDSGPGFFTISRDGRQLVRSHLAPGLPLRLEEGSAAKQGTRVVRFVWDRTGTALYVEAVVNEVRNLWRVRVDPTTLAWQSAERLTAGAGADVDAALAHDGTRLVFTMERNASRLWVFPFDAAAGRLMGAGKPLTPEESVVTASALAPDGSKAAYTLGRPGSRSIDLWVVDVTSGASELLAQNVLTARWSHEGKAVAYTLFRPDPGEWALAVRALSGPERLLSAWSANSAFMVSDWTRDGAAFLGTYYSTISSAPTVALWPSDAQSSKPARILMADPPARLFAAHFSPNGRWMSFLVGRPDANEVELRVAPAGGAPAVKWRRIAADHVFPAAPEWAPDGRMIYFMSRYSGTFYNLWGVRFDAEKGGPVGAPFMITRFNSASQMISPTTIGDIDVGISAARALLTLATKTGSVWMLDNVDK
jgi:eukaryotic-like serine/threonine-protein kinase